MATHLVHALLLNMLLNAKEAHVAQTAENDARPGTHPRNDREDEHDPRREGAAVSTVKDTGAVVSAVAVVGVRVIFLGGEQAGHDHTEAAAEEMHRDREHNVVDTQGIEGLDRAEVDEAREEADDEGSVGLDDRAGGGHGDKAAQQSVLHVAELERVLAVSLAVHERADEQAADAAGSGADGGGDHGLGGDEAVVDDVEGRDAVETVPAHPEDEGAEGAENGSVLGRVVAGQLDERARGVRLAGLTGAKEVGATERGNAARHVHDSGAGEVDDAASEQKRVLISVRALPGRRPAFGVPAPANDGRVDETGEHDRVDHVRGKGAALGDRARGDGGGRGRKRPLEHPHAVLVAVIAVLAEVAEVEAERVSAHEAVGLARAAHGDSEAGNPPHERTDQRVEEVLDKSVRRVLAVHVSDLKHGKPCLHEEHQDRAEA
mmetsp:Transcript_75957/g.216723  ORF Transcript_75957/g.216723 Transcript_75957/m.216723 type:complete len:433 (+) Transcript_75957:115-1413(+)